MMQLITNPLQIVASSAHELYWKALESMEQAEPVDSIQNVNSIGSGWGQSERPTMELRYVSLILTNSRNRLICAPFASLERIIPRTLLATLSDEKELTTLAFYDPRAKEFSEDQKTIETNYGYRIRHFEQINQIDQVISQFKKDRATRRAVIHIHTASDAEKKYDPCIDSLHFLIRNNQLECISHFRSENVLTLLPTNLFEFTMLQELIASELGIAPGLYIQTITSLHYYLDDQEKLNKTLESNSKQTPPLPMEPMPEKSLKQVELIRTFEKKWRESPSQSGEYKERLTDYWQKIADVIAYTIAKKSEQILLSESLKKRLAFNLF